MCRILVAAACAILTSLGPLFGQGLAMVGVGYADPAFIRLAPGQVITIYVAGATTVLPLPTRSEVATKTPLPTTLANFSVSLAQGRATIPVPLFSVHQIVTCGDPTSVSPNCLRTALMIETPFELEPNSQATLSVSENGVQSQPVVLQPVMDNIHVIRTCETDGTYCLMSTEQEYPYPAVVTHADGTLVSNTSPAKSGETVVVYVFGLGWVSGIQDGALTPMANTQQPALNFYIQFDFRPNAPGVPPYVVPFQPLPQGTYSPVYVGLTPGEIGLYQINVTLPVSFPAHLPFCDLPGPPVFSAFNPPVVSNLTIDIGGISSFDGAAICVQPSQ